MTEQNLRFRVVAFSSFSLLLLLLLLFGAGSLTRSAEMQAYAQPELPNNAIQTNGNNPTSPSESAARGAAAIGSWTDIAPFPTVTISPTPGTFPLRLKRAAAAAYPPNGKIYLLGGRHGVDGEDVTLQWIWEYTPGETPGDPGSWQRKNGLLDQIQPGDRYTANMAVAVLTDTTGPKIYAIGGNDINSQPTPVVRIYDPEADAVSYLPSADNWPASPLRIPGGYAVYNNKLYIFGGFSAVGAPTVLADTWEFDPMGAVGQKWRRLMSADLNTPRGYTAGVVLDGMIYAVGGDQWDSVGRTLIPVNNVERLDLSQASPTWAAVASLPTALGDLGAWAYDTGTGYEISGHILAAGGVYPEPDGNAFLYDPTTDSWNVAQSLLHRTRNYGVAQLDGYLYALGGYDYSQGIPIGANFNQRYDANIPRSPTATVTGTPPTLTFTRTPTVTLTPTQTPCNMNYTYTTTPGTVVPGTIDTGNHGNDVVSQIILPFPFTIYEATYNTINVSSNGNLQFSTSLALFGNSCLPQRFSWQTTIFAYWMDLRTDGTNCQGGDCGIYYSVTGSAPNRILNVEWRSRYVSGGGLANFEVRLYEGPPSRFDIVIGDLVTTSRGPTIGVQNTNGTLWRNVICLGNPPVRTVYSFLGACTPQPTITPTFTITPTRTRTATHTPTPTATSAAVLVGHVTWQGPPPQPDIAQQLPITLTLKLGSTEVNYPTQNTDAEGFFTVPLSSLAPGTYDWRVKGPKYLARSGNVELTGDPVTQAELGLMAVGDSNDDNGVNVSDFNIMKVTFARECGNPDYDDRAEFTGDCRVNVADFNLEKVNFGQTGVPPIGPR